MADGRRVEDLLADRPDLQSPLAAILDVDAESDTWTFEDIPVDSGAFGELVARDIVEKEGNEYRLADPDAVRRALEDGSPAERAPATDDGTTVSVDVSLPAVNARAVGMLAGALALVVLMRSYVVRSIFRDGAVVLSGNDPYFYRYWVEQSLASSDALTTVPSGIEHGEPLLVATLAWLSALAGGIDSAGAVLAVYPVVSAVLTAVLLYWLTLRLTDDRRIALATVVVLAVMPSHGLRTALGFADHHAFDYVWLALTAAALVALADVKRRDHLGEAGPWLAALALGIGVGAQTLAWDNGPLLLVPIAALVPLRVLVDVHADRSPSVTHAPVIVGLGLATGLAVVGHVRYGWHTPVVTVTPALLLAGTVAIVAVGELAHRIGRPVRDVAILEALCAAVVGTVAWTSFPDLQQRLLRGLGVIGRTDDIAEVNALFSGDTLGFLLLFGLFLFLGVPVLAWISYRRAPERPPWLVACVYAWYFFSLSLFQVRFAGQLGIFLSPFAAVGFVWLAAAIDLTQRPALFDTEDSDSDLRDWVPNRPDASTITTLLALFVLVGGLGVMQTAITVEQVTTEDTTYETAAWMADYADEQGWESQSESYVFSEWGWNRLYNYFVNGESRSYGYAQSNYQKIMTQTEPAEATSMLADRVRFIVTRDRDTDGRMMHARLHDNLGSREGDVAGLGQYRAVFTAGEGARKAFLVVPGATIRGSGPADTTADVTTDVDIPGTSFTYERQAATNATGAYAVRVAQPGTYDVPTANGTTTVTVPEAAVMNGTTVAVAE
jgi:dolichyl-diphosphooligosaccharide--protein glycosyltransferase